MKKITSILLFLAFSLSSFAQGELFMKSISKLAYGSTILDAAMLFKKDHPEFNSLVKGPVEIKTFTNPYDETQTFKIEAFYLVNEKDKQLIQLHYVNDALYEKGVYWFLHKDSVALVETNYLKAKNRFLSSPVLLAAEQGKVKAEEKSSELGKRTFFPVEKRGKNVREGEAGYELVYTRETGARGFWVFMQAYNTMENGLDTSMEIVHANPPKGIFDELRQLLIPVQE